MANLIKQISNLYANVNLSYKDDDVTDSSHAVKTKILIVTEISGGSGEREHKYSQFIGSTENDANQVHDRIGLDFKPAPKSSTLITSNRHFEKTATSQYF